MFESFILGHFIHSLMGYGKRSSPRKSAALDEPLRTRCLVRGLELLGLGAHFEVFGSLFVGKDPPAYHLNAELIGIVWDHKRHRNGADYPGCNGRALAYAAKALGVRHDEFRGQFRKRGRRNRTLPRAEMHHALCEIELEFDRLRAAPQDAEGKRLRERRNRADRPCKELSHRKRRVEEPLHHSIGRGCYHRQSRVLNRIIELNLRSGRGQLAYVGLLDWTLVGSHRVAERARFQDLKPGVAVIGHDQPLVNRAGRRGTPAHGDQRRH